MSYSTTKLILGIIPVLVCLLFSQWPSITGVLGSCNDDQYWDKIAGSCSSCTGICGIYDKTTHRDCLCICSPEDRECKGKEFDQSGLVTKSDVSRLETWLIILSVFVVISTIGLLLGVVVYCMKHRTVSRRTEQNGENNTQRDATEIPLLDRKGNQVSSPNDQPDKPDVPEETEPRTIDEPGSSSADPLTGINNVQEEGRQGRDLGLVHSRTYDHKETMQ